MNFEQQNFKFNKENFNRNFKSLLAKYFEKNDESVRHHYSEEEIKHIDSYGEELTKQLVSLCMNALKSSDNKKEILDMISDTYFDLSPRDEETLELQYWREKEFFKKIILELGADMSH